MNTNDVKSRLYVGLGPKSSTMFSIESLLLKTFTLPVNASMNRAYHFLFVDFFKATHSMLVAKPSPELAPSAFQSGGFLFNRASQEPNFPHGRGSYKMLNL